MKRNTFLYLIKILTVSGIIAATIIAAECKIRLVLGSDTAIWNGMGTSQVNDTYNPELYTDPTMNAYQVMADNYRSNLTDSYGTPMKLTWWMMCGNIFRYATNTDCPIPNIMTMYHMKEHHLPQIEKWGDELSLHYHTFKWSDYDQDGVWHWNQAETFEECREDFDFTLCQLLLEEENFFVSFRSGWHYMDNDWQAYLNELMPFSMHNAYGSYKDDPEEPTNNNIDWRQAPEEWIPYQPSAENYQLPGGNAGWNLRSIHLRSVTNPVYLDSIFARASRGISQVACLWGHLPEEDFLDNLAIIDSIAHQMEEKYGEPFKYCTAVEAMQEWLPDEDNTAPELSLNETGSDEALYIDISVSEPIFQKYPYVAVKDIFENYYKMECEPTGELSWRTKFPLNKNHLAKIGVAVCDSLGNQDLEFLSYLPDDKFIDNQDAEYHEIAGSFSNSSAASWGADSRISPLQDYDSVKVRYDLNTPQSTYYNLFYQIPDVANRAADYSFQILSDGELIKTIKNSEIPPANQWNYIATVNLKAEKENHLTITIPGENQPNAKAVFDVVKITPLVRESDLTYDFEKIQFGEISVNVVSKKMVTLQNKGYKELIIDDVHSMRGYFETEKDLPLTIQPMSEASLQLSIYSENIEVIQDTLIIMSNDVQQQTHKIPVSAKVKSYFIAIDNEDKEHYSETGNWKTSVTQVYGSSSRFSSLNQTPRATATFSKKIDYTGVYNLEFIVPVTVNSSNNARYQVLIDGTVIDSKIFDQNKDSGSWIAIGQYKLYAGAEVAIRVADTGNNTNPDGLVLRADAARFSLLDDATDIEENPSTPMQFSLAQNFPNPFNASTVINYSIPEDGKVRLSIYNMVGQEVETLVEEKQTCGYHKVKWNANHLSTGIYFYRLTFQGKSYVKRLLLIK